MAGNVHVGNVLEFHEAYLPERLDEQFRREILAGDDQYASMAALYSPDPGLVLVPDLDGAPWWDYLADLLRWTHFRPVTLPGPSNHTFDALDGHRDLREDIVTAVKDGAALIPWGETESYRRFVEDLPAELAVRCTDGSVPRFVESKENSGAVFAEVYSALGRPAGVHLTREWFCQTEAELSAALVAAGERGDPVVLKAPFGVGGYGTTVVGAHRLTSARAVTRLLTEIRERDSFHRTLPTIVHEFQWRSATPWSDVSGDCTIDALGRVRLEGVTAMTVNGTQFSGGITDDGVVLPPERSALLTEFCLGVGEVLSRIGYRGWFDIDFIVRVTGELVPLEINARRTGTTAPLSVKRRVEDLRGTPVTVICQDGITLPRRLASRAAFDRFRSAVAACGLDGDVVPTLVAGTDAPQPYLGVCVLGRDGAEATERLARFTDALVANCLT